jgi:methyltransferase
MRLLVCAAMALARVGELGISRRNIRESANAAEGPWSRATYPAIVALHTATIAGTFALGRTTQRRWLFALLAVQPLRAWVLLTLGRRWNARAAVPPAMEIETGGPYAFVRHPNYAVIGVELATLPLAFGLPRLAFAASVANACLLAPRIREEEAALMRLPGYRAHFAEKARFVPFVV